MAVKKIISIVLIEVAIICVIIFVLIAAAFFKCENDDLLNAQRLKALQTDGILSCSIIDKLTPLSQFNRDHAGSHIFGNYSTEVYREFHINNVNLDSAKAAFAQCAQANGWNNLIMAHGFQKFFPGGWKATLDIYGDAQTIHVRLETDGI
jgi:hypothetical protein